MAGYSNPLTDPGPLGAGSGSMPFTAALGQSSGYQPITSPSPPSGFTPNSLVQGDVTKTPFWAGFTNRLYNTTPAIGGAAYLRQTGNNLFSPYASFLGSHLSGLYAGYQQQQVNQPGLSFLNYLGSQEPAMQNAYGYDQFQQGRAIAPRRIL